MSSKFGIEQHTVYSRLTEFILETIKFDKELLTPTLEEEMKKFTTKNRKLMLEKGSKILKHLARSAPSSPGGSGHHVNHHVAPSHGGGNAQSDHMVMKPVFGRVWESPTHCGQFLFHFNSHEVVEQLTVIDWTLYSRITKQELQQLKWDKPLEKALCHNVTRVVERLNHLATWVAVVILSFSTDYERAAARKYFISVARLLLQMKNFSSFMGVMTGLNNPAVERLSKSTTIFQKMFPNAANEFEQLNALQDPTGSFKTLRATVKNAGSQVLPYLGTTLGELLLIDEGNENTITIEKTGEVVPNLPKFVLVTNSVNAFLQFQKISQFGNMKPAEPLYSFLQTLPTTEAALLYEVSAAIEARAK